MMLLLLLFLVARSVEAQGNGAGAPAHPVVCADGVHRYASLSEVPVPFDSLRMPPAPPVRVTSPEEERAAEREMLRRAGQAGATGLAVVDETSDQGGGRMMRRRAVPVFVAADSARAQAACRGAAKDSASTGSSRATPSREEALRRIEALADSLARADRFAGVVLVAQDGRPVLHRAWGSARREQRQPVTADMAFNLSSLGKLFTRVAVAQLVAAGKMSLDAPVVRYWPDYPDRDAAERVTIGQLLEHRSGIGGDIFDPAMHSFRSNHDYLRTFVGRPLEFPPGTKESYSNAGYVLLGELIARVSGETYEAYVRRHIFEPVGMMHTDFLPYDSLPPAAAMGYTQGEQSAGPWRPSTAQQPGRGSAAGGAFSTAGDLLLFTNAVRDGTLQSGEDRRASEAALGGSPGSNTALFRNVPGGYDVIVLANMDPPVARTIAEAAEGWLAGNYRAAKPRMRVSIR